MLGALLGGIIPSIAQGAIEKGISKKAEKKAAKKEAQAANPEANAIANNPQLAGIKQGKDGKYELTQAQFKQLLAANGKSMPIAKA